MNTFQNQEDDFLLTFHDLIRIIKKNARKIWIGSALFAMLTLTYAITRPVVYQAEASFREKGKRQAGVDKSLLTQLVGESNDSDALTLMKSRNLMEDLIQKMNWQAHIVKDERSFPFFPLQTIKNNLLTEYALITKRRHPIIKEPAPDLKIEFVSYEGEIPLTYKLLIDSEKSFTIVGHNGTKIAAGTFGYPLSAENFTLTLLPGNQSNLTGNEYTLTLLPLGKFAEGIQKEFLVEADKNDKGLLKITYRHPDRRQAAEAVKSLMSVYHTYIYHEHLRTCCLQVDYLVQRQKEMGQQLADVMQKHADGLSSDLSNTGFATSGKAMEFLAHNQQNLKQKLLAIDLDIQRLENMRQTSEVDYENIASANLPEAINRLATEIRTLKQQADALNLALRNSPTNSEAFQQSFSSQMVELGKVKNETELANTMLASLKNDQLPEPLPALLDNPKFIVKLWYERAQACHAAKQDWQECRDAFISYLSHLIYYLNIYQRNIEEHLAHQQTPMAEFQGINLNTAKELFITYSKDLSETESEAIQQRFIISQISDPAFEISSLSTVLSDPISTEMISKASAIILALKDSDNRSIKEQERLKADLAIQKGFLTTHLEQSLQLLNLRQEFLKEKILSLQSITLSLSQEQISLLENQIKKYIANAIVNLQQEQNLLQGNLEELRAEMSAFPQKWAAEQLIEHQMAINQTMVEEISKLVETKNISNNLEKIQSAPLDLPIVPLHPKSPRLLLLTLLGAAAGALFSMAWVLANSILNGVETSSENLRLAGFHVSGNLSNQINNAQNRDHILDNDLNTLRRAMAFIDHTKEIETNTIQSIPLQISAKSFLLLQNQGPNYAPSLANLMSKKGLKVLIVDLSFENYSETGPGILQYLEGTAPEPTITHGKSFDLIHSGGICRYSNELITSQRFLDLIAKYHNKYDWMLITSKASLSSAEAESLLEIFHNALISLTGESWDQLRGCLRAARQFHVSFLFTLPKTNWHP